MQDRSTPISRLLIDLQDALHQLKESIREYQKTESAQKEEILNAVRERVVRLPVEITEYYGTEEAERPKKNKRDTVRFWFEIVGVLVAIALVILTLCTLRTFNGQLIEMRTQTKQGLESFHVDERAWMGFKFVEGNISLTLNKSFLVPTELVNTGKTPARNVHGDVVVGVFKDGEALDFSYTSGAKHPFYHVQAGTIFPGGKITESFEAIQHGANKAEPVIFTESLKNALFLPHKSYIIVHGKIIYNDVFGIEHWTTYCRYVLHPELISEECTRYNDTDDQQQHQN